MSVASPVRSVLHVTTTIWSLEGPHSKGPHWLLHLGGGEIPGMELEAEMQGYNSIQLCLKRSLSVVNTTETSTLTRPTYSTKSASLAHFVPVTTF